MTRARRDEADQDEAEVSADDERAGAAIAAAAQAAGIAAGPEPAETPLPPAVIGLRWVYSPGEVRLQYTTDAQTWIEVPYFKFDEIEA